MLINKPLSEGDIVSIKLINGDEIIARYQDETVDNITINKPLALTVGQGGLGMIPWMFLGNKDTITLRKDQTFVIMPSKKDAATQYLEGTTGIAIK
ncbi:MAG: hypothetical protein EBX47_10305 [Synechococcaceae bacterium WB8_1B_057]|nr:hypothetical protein [Synechococcaceae bacterium WB6_1A_059]NDG79804.1 hypothetical protein [Synechococcaceae bacterium WB8_1B_057]